MSEEEIKEKVTLNIEQSLTGAEKESSKFDFKREWYKLNESAGVNEFLKDVTAIANTPGGGDGFIVIGYDEKKKTFQDASFKDSSLKDISDIYNLMVRRLSNPVKIYPPDQELIIQGIKRKISIIHIPYSNEKPHVIKNYQKNGKERQHVIFVRKNSGTHPASKTDLDLMYWENGNYNTALDFDPSIDLLDYDIDHNIRHNGIRIDLLCGNKGKKHTAIIRSRLEINWNLNEKTNTLWDVRLINGVPTPSKTLILKSNEIKEFSFVFCPNHHPKCIKDMLLSSSSMNIFIYFNNNEIVEINIGQIGMDREGCFFQQKTKEMAKKLSTRINTSF